MTWIVTWSEKGDRKWGQCYTLNDAERIYREKLKQEDLHEISLCEVKRSTADWYHPEVTA